MGWFNHQPARLKIEPQNDYRNDPKDDFSISPLVPLKGSDFLEVLELEPEVGVTGRLRGGGGVGFQGPKLQEGGGFRKGNKNSQILKNSVGNVAQKRQKKASRN